MNRRICTSILVCCGIAGLTLTGVGFTARGGSDSAAPLDAAPERGRLALTEAAWLQPAWKVSAYREVVRLWDGPAPDPERDPIGYAAAFERRYGVSPAPFPNDGFPMGLRLGRDASGKRSGLQLDCLVCHGGSIGGKSYIGLGNSQLDLKGLLYDMTRADGQRPPFGTFTLSSSRGTNNAGMIAAVLLSLRNVDLSRRILPLPLGVNLPEMDTPAWWLLKRKKTMYYDGRTPAASVRTNMQFLLGEKSLEEFKELEPAFRDLQAYLKTLEPPKYPFPIDHGQAERGARIFKSECARCHGTYGPGGSYPNKIIPLDVIGTDPRRALGLSDRLVAHYNATWFGEHFPANPKMTGYQAPPLDGIWATAPYLHNGSVPTLAQLLEPDVRPAKFTRPPSTDLEHYDPVRVGWKHDVIDDSAPPKTRRTAWETSFIFDSSRFGLDNSGHTFGDELTDGERIDLIEYLKTL